MFIRAFLIVVIGLSAIVRYEVDESDDDRQRHF
jgi:hypothetical protein